MSEVNLTKFQQRIAEKRAREAAEAKGIQHDEDLIPEASDGFERSDADLEMDQVIESIDIVDAYNRWCGKMRPTVRAGQTEGIKISCPNPDHPDKNPSAWINTDKQTWFCAGCDLGGDAHDIAAWHFGFPVPGYKSGAPFHELRRKMAQDFGFTITRVAGGVTVITPPEEEAGPEGTVEGKAQEEIVDIADVFEMYDDSDTDIELPGLPWDGVVKEEGTFLWEYMNATVIDDVPEEYHFFHALLAIGFALGRDVMLQDSKPVQGNLFVCLLGKTGAGKSKAASYLEDVLHQAMPYDADPINKGVKKISSPGSAEVLVYNFMKPVEDPSAPKKTAYYAPVKGLIEFGELSSLVARMDRQGSAMKPTLMEFYDGRRRVETSSMTTGAKIAQEPFASALTTTQPRALRGLISRTDDASGFLNRWVFVPGTTKQRFAIGTVQVDLTDAVVALKNIVGWAGSFTGGEMVEWSDSARTLYTNFFQEFIDRDETRDDTNLLGRMNLTMKKLILLFSANRREREVSVQSVEDALYCYKYLIQSYGVLEDQIGNTLNNEVAEALLFQAQKYTEKHKKGATIRELLRPLQRRKYPMDMVKKTLDVLVALERLKVEASTKGSVGRPTVRYKYVD